MSIVFQVDDMTCGHCVRAITEAVQQADPAAKVLADVGTHRVTIDSQSQAAALEAVIREAGYTPVQV